MSIENKPVTTFHIGVLVTGMIVIILLMGLLAHHLISKEDKTQAANVQSPSWTVNIEDRDGREMRLRVPYNSSLKATSVGAHDDIPYTIASTRNPFTQAVNKRQGHVHSGWKVTATAAGDDHVNVVLSQSKFLKMDHARMDDGLSIDLPVVLRKEASFQLTHGQSRTVNEVKISVLP